MQSNERGPRDETHDDDFDEPCLERIRCECCGRMLLPADWREHSRAEDFTKANGLIRKNVSRDVLLRTERIAPGDTILRYVVCDGRGEECIEN
jgi:hypothetical protein